MNDENEWKIAFSILDDLVSGLPSSERAFGRELKSRVEDISGVNVCVVSFSEDGDLLSQWRPYCAAGGVSIGFDFVHLSKMSKKQGFMQPLRCIYDDGEQSEAIRAIFDRVLLNRRQGIDESKCIDRFMEKFGRIAGCFKNKAFREEREWRLVTYPVSVLNPHFEIRATRSMLLPFFRFGLQGNEDKTKVDVGLRKVIVGPHAHQDLIEHTVVLLLSKHRIYLWLTEKSDIPYRTF